MSVTTPVHRPFGVGLLSILLIVSGIFDVVGGIVVLATRNDVEVRDALREVTADSLTALAVTTIVVGVIVILVGFGVRRGANWARAVVAGVAIAHVSILVWGVIAYHGYHWYQALLPAALYLIITGYLFSDEDAKRYFERSYTS